MQRQDPTRAELVKPAGIVVVLADPNAAKKTLPAPNTSRSRTSLWPHKHANNPNI